jgi:hypothetical protein
VSDNEFKVEIKTSTDQGAKWDDSLKLTYIRAGK